MSSSARESRSPAVCWATLVPEPDNPFDGHAVAVNIQGETVGYVSCGDARRYQSRLRALEQLKDVPQSSLAVRPTSPPWV
jgi:hypothetical protein